MYKLENYNFGRKKPLGKYRRLLDEFERANQKFVAWKCTDKKELHAACVGFNKELRNRNAKSIIRVRYSSVDLVVGLERLYNE